jgi:hypothetical protein
MTIIASSPDEFSVPHISCNSLNDIFYGKQGPTYTIGRDCNDTGVYDYTQMCNCQSLSSLHSLCGRDDWGCYNVTHDGQYLCHAVQCQHLYDGANYTVTVTHDGVYPSTANYKCRDGFTSVDPMSRMCQFQVCVSPPVLSFFTIHFSI